MTARRSQMEANLKARYRMTLQQYEDMFVAQGGVCALCSNECSTGKRLAVDHDHRSGRVRALLCTNCNSALGKFGESQERLRNAADYLDHHTFDVID